MADGVTLTLVTPGQGLETSSFHNLEKVTLFMSFFSIAAWTDLMISWVCSMLMFQEAWVEGRERLTAHQPENKDQACTQPPGPNWPIQDQGRVMTGWSECLTM